MAVRRSVRWSVRRSVTRFFRLSKNGEKVALYILLFLSFNLLLSSCLSISLSQSSFHNVSFTFFFAILFSQSFFHILYLTFFLFNRFFSISAKRQMHCCPHAGLLVLKVNASDNIALKVDRFMCKSKRVWIVDT